jgi:hypothetical protein
VNSGDDLANSAFALVQICALPGFTGRPFRIEMTALPNEWISLECRDLGVPPTDWKRPEQLFSDLLSSAGYKGPVPEEVKGSVRVIASALSGPKGVILKGQIESLGVLRADIEYGYKVMKDQPPKKWINGSARWVMLVPRRMTVSSLGDLDVIRRSILPGGQGAAPYGKDLRKA